MTRLVLAATLALQLASGQSDQPRIFEEIDSIMAELSDIMGLKPKRKVEHDSLDKAALKRYIEERLKENVKPEEIRAEELTLKKFGFVPPDFDLAGSTVDLLTEQAAAFYDFKRRKLYMVESAGSSAVEKPVLVHELAHALADQHFNLQKFIERAGKSDDSALARMAVMEGQASWLMSEYVARQVGQSLRKSRAVLEMFTRMGDGAAGEFPVLEKSPLYIRETLLFPYTKGVLFQNDVLERMGNEAFAEVFRRPPVSTQQILHPQKYFDRVKPTDPALPEPSDPKRYRTLMEGMIGELDHSILLRQYHTANEADALAPEWRGGRYRLLEQKEGGRLVLAYSVEWSGTEIARRYRNAYLAVMKKREHGLRIRSESDDEIRGELKDGMFLLRLDGAVVSSLEGVSTLEGVRVAGVN